MSTTEAMEIDGIPVLFARTTGPTRAGLMFRVGQVDETLPTNGVSHLVEHLALHRHGVTDYHYNGLTSTTTTQFVIQGTPDSVVAFVNDVCANLRDLPIGRLATEKRIIETEEATQPFAVNRQLPLWRYGARGYGLAGYQQWGMRTLDEDQVLEWAETRFTRGNAVLWYAGEQLPSGLKLDLPDGPRWPLPVESSAVPVLPAFFTADSPVLVMDGRVPRTGPGTLFTRALDRALFRELRQNRGLSYTAAAAYGTDGRTSATVTVVVDAQPSQLDSAMDCLLAELRRLGSTELDGEELEAVRAREIDAMAQPDVEANLLPRRATDLLTGFAARTSAQIVDGFRGTTPDQIRDTAATFLGSALLLVPQAVHRRPAGFEHAPVFSRFAVSGRRHRSRENPEVFLSHGTDGVSLSTPHGPHTVLFDECEALLRWPDGARQLIGEDAISIRIEPTLFPTAVGDLARIDDAVRPDVVVDLPARDPSRVPKPSRARRLRQWLRVRTLPVRARWNRVAATRGGGWVFVATGRVVAVLSLLALGIGFRSLCLVALGVVGGGALLYRKFSREH